MQVIRGFLLMTDSLKGLRHIVIVVCAAAMLSACSGTASEVGDMPKEEPVEQLYLQATNAMDARKFKEAARMFDEVERQHPYSKWATRAQLMAAYAHYQDLEYDDALLALERFIQLHPGNEDIAYAYYLRALCYYEQITDVRRDQAMTESALDALRTVIRRFPDSQYARDSSLKMDLTMDHLAGKEMEIGRYYLRRANYNAAINRFKAVVRDYQTTTHVPEALHRLTESYLALGVEEEAKKTAAVLGYNFPGSKWYADSYSLFNAEARAELDQSEKNWLSRKMDDLF